MTRKVYGYFQFIPSREADLSPRSTVMKPLDRDSRTSDDAVLERVPPIDRSTCPGAVRFVTLTVVIMCAFAFISCKWTASGPNEVTRLDKGWQRPNLFWREKLYPELIVPRPEIPNATYVREDRLCHVCHKTHVELFQDNVHRKLNCEDCHGAASEHLVTRGKEPGKIWNFKTMNRAASSEMCLKCHDQDACSEGPAWRTSAHAHNGVSCTDCHQSHYHVPAGTAKISVDDESLLAFFEDYQQLVAMLRRPMDTAKDGSQSQFVAALPEAEDETTPREAGVSTVTGVEPQQALANSPLLRLSGRGGASLEILSKLQLASDPDVSKDLPSLRGTSEHLQAIVPVVCYRCHGQMHQYEEIAHPHQINGTHGFTCSTCHNPHGNILETSRKELCLECHKDAPTTAWHSSTHDLAGVACTDCHDPHPDTSVQQTANIRHPSIQRPPRLPMSVDDPFTCYKCHSKIQAEFQLPSHHPIIEGKMTCGNCHDPHGHNDGMLNEDTVNLTCYKCHADLQGPFVYQHPPAEENCSYCHNPHGAVSNHLLLQPATFLCLRCHAGHRADPSEHFGIGTSNIDGNPGLRPVFYTDCTNCHRQVHGSNLPSQNRAGALLR